MEKQWHGVGYDKDKQANDKEHNVENKGHDKENLGMFMKNKGHDKRNLCTTSKIRPGMRQQCERLWLRSLSEARLYGEHLNYYTVSFTICKSESSSVVESMHLWDVSEGICLELLSFL